MKINDLRGEQSELIEVGDMVEFDEMFYWVIENEARGKVILVDVERKTVYEGREFEHPKHVHNHIRKHYGEYKLIKAEKIELTFH